MDKTDAKKLRFRQVKQKMMQQFVDLYKYWELERPEGAAGWLHCYVQPSPVSADGRLRPGVLVIPGGGYGHVSQREAEPVALRFLCRGYQAFVLDYSVAPLQFPVQLREAAMAMGYIRRHGQQLGVDPGMVAAVGFSAGGHLCGMLGTLFDAPEVADIGSAQLLRPDALGLCYPVAVSWGETHEGSFQNLCGDNQTLRQRLSLDRLVRSDMPPVYLWHTRDDGSVPCRNTFILAQAVETAGVELAMRVYLHGKHGLSTADAQVYLDHEIPQMSPSIPNWPEEMIGFFEEIGLRVKDVERKV